MNKKKAIIDDTPLAVRDNIHLNIQRIDSYNKTDNFIITTRGMGKTSAMWSKCYNEYKNGLVPVIQKNRPVEITKEWISDIEDTLNLFRKPSEYCKLRPTPGSKLGSGAVDVQICEKGKDYERFFRVIPISIEVKRFKSMCIGNIGNIYVDEFLPDVDHGERWLNGFTWRADTLYSTLARFKYQVQKKTLKRYWFGNPYSRYIPPIFERYNVDTFSLQAGQFLVGKDYIIDMETPSKELQELLEKENPLLLNSINEEWDKFMKGQFYTDDRYIIEKEHPKNYSLRWVFKFAGHQILVFSSSSELIDSCYNNDVRFWCKLDDKWAGDRRSIFCFDFSNLTSGTQLMMNSDRLPLLVLKTAMGRRKVAFADVNCASIMEEIYKLL